MRINLIQIDSFAGLQDFSYRPTDGLQVLLGRNESGKSTIMTFIRVLFYGAGKNSKDPYKSVRRRFKPWDSEGLYGGFIEFTHEGEDYILDRRFGKSKRSDELSLYMQNGREIDLTGQEPGEFLTGLSEDEFINSFFSAVPETDAGGFISLKRHSAEKGLIFSYEDSYERLRAARKELVHERGKGGKIFEMQNKLFKLDSLYNEGIQSERELAEQLKRREEIRRELSDLQSKTAKLKENRIYYEALAKKQSCLEIMRHAELLQEAEEKLQRLKFKSKFPFADEIAEDSREKALQRFYSARETFKRAYAEIEEKDHELQEYFAAADQRVADLETEVSAANKAFKRARVDRDKLNDQFQEIRKKKDKLFAVAAAMGFVEIILLLSGILLFKKYVVIAITALLFFSGLGYVFFKKYKSMQEKQRDEELYFEDAIEAKEIEADDEHRIYRENLRRLDKFTGRFRYLYDAGLEAAADLDEAFADFKDAGASLLAGFSAYYGAENTEVASEALNEDELRAIIIENAASEAEKRESAEESDADKAKSQKPDADRDNGILSCLTATEAELSAVARFKSEVDDLLHEVDERSDAYIEPQDLSFLAERFTALKAECGLPVFLNDNESCKTVSLTSLKMKKLKAALDAEYDVERKEVKAAEDSVNERRIIIKNYPGGYNSKKIAAELAEAEQVLEDLINEGYDIEAADRNLKAVLAADADFSFADEKEIDEEAIKAGEKQADAMQERIKQLLDESMNIERNIGQMQTGGPPLADIEHLLEAKRREYKNTERLAEILQVAMNAVKYYEERFEDSFRPRLSAAASGYLAAASGEKYSYLQLDPDCKASLRAEKVGGLFHEAYFSAGTRDLIFLSLRLGLCKILYGAGEAFPLFLDDSLLQADVFRLSHGIMMLKDEAIDSKRQIFYFTKDKDVYNIAESFEIPVTILNADNENY